ncbi:MAG: hypothetical protein ACI9EW_003583 [Cellvibrionaceae bacterium]|jgi:hypothetical protein
MDISMVKAVIKNLNLMPLITFIVGFFVGLVIFGWYLTPVSYVDGAPQDLRNVDYQQYYLRGLADQYAFNQISAESAVGAIDAANWPDAHIAVCDAANRAASGSLDGNGNTIVAASPVSEQRLNNLVEVLGKGTCDQIANGVTPENAVPGEAPEEPASGNRWLTSLGWLIMLGLLIAAFWWLWNRDSDDDDNDLAPVTSAGSSRASKMDSDERPAGFDADDSAGGDEGGITPISVYRTTYAFGQNSYDDSFSIENASEDFLGECGVGISETMGSGPNKSVSALEVWLFDKNDIRTITKVAMSEHIWMDEAVRAKLEPKGEAVKVNTDEIIVLETASLIINARITELEYGTNPELPENSYFERISIEMSAWSKNDAAGGDDSFDFD